VHKNMFRVASIVVVGCGTLWGHPAKALPQDQAASTVAHPTAPTVPTPPVRTLELKRTLSFSGSPANGFLPGMRCASGNIFVRFPRFNPRDYTLINSPVSELVLDSTQVIQFGANPLPDADYPDQNWQYFDVDGKGTVYALIHTSGFDPNTSPKGRFVSHDYIERFKDDGTTDTIVQLKAPPDAKRIAIYHFGVFPGRNFLVAGSADTDSGERQPLTAVYDPSGRFVARVRLPADISLGEYLKGEYKPKSSNDAKQIATPSAASEDSRDVRVDDSNASRAGAAFEEAISTESVLGAPDGYVYLLRNSDPIRLYAVDATGEVIKSFQFSAPAPGLEPFNVGVAGADELFIHFEGGPATRMGGPASPEELVGLFNTVSGGFDAIYRLPDSVKHTAIPACADRRGGILYLGRTPDNHLAVFTYAP
jgi:hypothetical protein